MKTRITVSLIFLGVGVAELCAQSGRVVELRSADQLNVRMVAGEEVRDLVGNVHFVQPSETGTIRVWCDRARRYMERGRIDLMGNVRIVQDSVTLRGNEGTYFERTKTAFMRSGVVLTRNDMTLRALEGDYDGRENRADFRGNVVVVDSVSTTTCDSLIYFEDGDRSIAIGRVAVRSPRDGVTVFGDSLLHYGSIDYTLVPKNPKMVHVDTSSTGGIDTLVVVGRVMEAFRDTSLRYSVRDSVLLARNELSARCERALYRPEEGLAILEGNPIVWYGMNQVTGDSIAVRVEDNRLRSVYVAGRAMAVSQSDSLRSERYDQLTGRELTLYFGEENIERIEAVRNAISLYYLYDREVPNGVNRSSGDRIVVEFTEGLVTDITVTGGVEGVYRPEGLVVQRERTLNLDGFQWHQDRPKRRGIQIIFE